MVNHVRTWLGNIPPLSAMAAGDEFIEPQFTPVPDSSMSSDLRDVRNVLFGSGLSRDAINVRLAVYMAMIHHSALAADAVAKDTRLTYLPDGSDIYGSAISTTDLNHEVMTNVAKLEFLNNPDSSFFDDYQTYRDVWTQPNDPVKRLSAVLLTAAALTETAGATAQ